jgi:cytidylate kinase
MGEEKNVVLDGRDIGTNVFPNAEFKYYLTATPEVRARRRTDEMAARGEKPNYREVLCAINKRDENDMSRELNPLTQADDAILIVTDDMDAEEVANVIVKDVLAANVKY